jgi:hypothetical protein
MRLGARFLFLATVLILWVPLAMTQEDAPRPPVALGDFNLSGSATAGFRFTEVKGYEPQFRQMFDLGNGFRLLDLDVFGESRDGKNPFADSFSLHTSSLGGDPFPSAQFAISKHNLYDFRVDWRQSYYFWNQNDNVVLPIAASTVGLSKGLTSNRDWSTVRKFGSLDFTLHATNHLRFRFNYYRPSDEGNSFTTRSLDFLGSPGYWGSFARANPYSLFAPLSDSTNRFTGGLDYTWKDWNFHYALGYQTFTENTSLNSLTSPEFSINPITLSTTEPLNHLSWSQYRRLTTPISEFSFLGKPLPKLEWRGGYTFYRYRGPATFDQAFDGIAPGPTAGTLVPYSVTQSARATVTEPNHIISQGLTYHFFSWWSADLDYRYSRFTSHSTGNFQSLFDGTTPALATTNVIWRDGLSHLTLRMIFAPRAGLQIRPGIQLMRSDVVSIADGVVEAPTTLRTNTVRPEIGFSYEPSKLWSVRGDFHTMTNGASFTAITPHTQQATHFVLRFHPIPKLSIEDELSIANNKLLTTKFQNNLRADALTISYSLGERFSVFGGFSYESYYAQGNILYIRGTPPLSNFLRNQELNRVWSGGIDGRPTKRLGLRLSGNFDHSSGTGTNSGEAPAYGPLTWPLVTGTISYDLPKAGRLAVDLQRTYYNEDIVTGNNFSANLLTLRWTRSF